MQALFHDAMQRHNDKAGREALPLTCLLLQLRVLQCFRMPRVLYGLLVACLHLRKRRHGIGKAQQSMFSMFSIVFNDSDAAFTCEYIERIAMQA